MAFLEGLMGIATFSAIAKTTGGVIQMNGAPNAMIFAPTATTAFGAENVMIGKRRMIGGCAFVPVRTKQEVLQETGTEAMQLRMTETMQMREIT